MAPSDRVDDPPLPYTTLISAHASDRHIRLVTDRSGTAMATVEVQSSGLAFQVIGTDGRPLCSSGVAPGTKMSRWRGYGLDQVQIVEYHFVLPMSIRVTVRDSVDWMVHRNNGLRAS
jgi:hypothetical protein